MAISGDTDCDDWGKEILLASGGWKAEVLQRHPVKYMEQLPQQRIIQPTTSTVLRIRNSTFTQLYIANVITGCHADSMTDKLQLKTNLVCHGRDPVTTPSSLW